jgi:5-hydroxyisourate hydrolase
MGAFHHATGDHMPGGISIHAVDVANGRPAQGLTVEIASTGSTRRVVGSGALNAHGALDHPVVKGEGIEAGAYEVLFHVGDFLQRQGSAHAGFLEVIVFRFVIARPEEHFHLPLKFTPWGYSIFRGS